MMLVKLQIKRRKANVDIEILRKTQRMDELKFWGPIQFLEIYFKSFNQE